MSLSEKSTWTLFTGTQTEIDPTSEESHPPPRKRRPPSCHADFVAHDDVAEDVTPDDVAENEDPPWLDEETPSPMTLFSPQSVYIPKPPDQQ